MSKKFNLYHFLFYCLYKGKHSFKASYEEEEDVLQSVNYIIGGNLFLISLAILANIGFFRLFPLELIKYVLIGLLILPVVFYLINKRIITSGEYKDIIDYYDKNYKISKKVYKTISILFPAISIASLILTGIFYEV